MTTEQTFSSSSSKPKKNAADPPSSPGDKDPINDLFLTQLTKIFAKKYALSLKSSFLLGKPSASSQEVKAELENFRQDLERVKKWVETTSRHLDKILEEPSEPAPPLNITAVKTPLPLPLKRWLVSAKKWLKAKGTLK